MAEHHTETHVFLHIFDFLGRRFFTKSTKKTHWKYECFVFFLENRLTLFGAKPAVNEKGTNIINVHWRCVENGAGAPPLLRAVFGLPATSKSHNRPALSRQGLHRPIRRPNDPHKVPKMTPKAAPKQPKKDKPSNETTTHRSRIDVFRRGGR